MTFALYFGNRGFFPESLIAGARQEMKQAVERAGHKTLIADVGLTRYGAVETPAEGRVWAEWLKSHEGKYDGVILCLPNFGDENGAIAALQDCGVPILLQAYPDEIGKMEPASRRDSYCGKFSIADVFHQYNLPFTMLEPHTVHPLSETFAQNLRDFAAICRVVNGMRRVTIGCIGARTTKFKTVRFDELTLQRCGITVETFDLSDLILRVQKTADSDPKVAAKVEVLKNYSDFGRVPEDRITMLAKVGVVLDWYVEEYYLDALALRCWEEMQAALGVAPCVLLGEMNSRMIPASCEVDLCSAINMLSLQLASEKPAACLDWNNNYGDAPDKVVLFHCGPVASELMTDGGFVTDHKLFAKANPGCGWGSNEGRIAPNEITVTSCKTEDGKLTFYAVEGRVTDDPIEEAFFGCCGVAEIPSLQPKLVALGQGGFRHHTVIGVGKWQGVLKEAFTRYLGYDWFNL